MTGVEWNKKEELLQDQALRHLKQYLPLFAAFTNNFKSEINLLNKIQEYCYDNMNFLKTFNKIILLLYKSKLFLLQKLEERSLLMYPSIPLSPNLCKKQSLKCLHHFFSVDILSEDAILKWYKESHSQRGWSVFMDQMKKFIEWLENADEGKFIKPPSLIPSVAV